MKYLFILFFITVFFGHLFAQKKTVVSEKIMYTIPKGTYLSFFANKNSKPIKVMPFLLDETAVTNVEYLTFTKANPQWRKSTINRLFADTNYLRHWENDTAIGKINASIYHSPVVNVSWFAAQAFCKWKNKRLPSVSEWELAAKAAPKKMNQIDITNYILGWYRKPNLPVLPNIKTTYQNIYGIHDMHGLIWEWTSNFNSFISSGDSRGNTEEDLKLFCAAGSLNVINKSDYASYIRFSYRGSLKGNYCIANLGFRCAKEITTF
jgi:formylglycine-generating enzyme required for sulfatase activity